MVMDRVLHCNLTSLNGITRVFQRNDAEFIFNLALVCVIGTTLGPSNAQKSARYVLTLLGVSVVNRILGPTHELNY